MRFSSDFLNKMCLFFRMKKSIIFYFFFLISQREIKLIGSDEPASFMNNRLNFFFKSFRRDGDMTMPSHSENVVSFL